MTANEKYALQDYENLLASPQMQLSSQLKTFSDVSVSFLEITLSFEHIEKKDERHTYIISQMKRLSKTWLDHSLKNTVSEHPSTVNMLNCPKLL